jgi:uncharacterized protein YsxB (DUF464 family)
MIAVSVTLSPDKVIRELHCTGHAGFALKGTDIVCSAFTLLLRTLARTWESSPEVEFQVLADDEGVFHIRTKADPVVGLEAFRGSCWFFLRGLDDLSRDFPEQITISYQQASGR